MAPDIHTSAGRVVRLDDAGAWLDVGAKCEAILPTAEFPDGAAPALGTELQVLLDGDPESEDAPLKAGLVERRVVRAPHNELLATVQPGQILVGTVTRRIVGGFLVDVGFIAFLADEDVSPEVLADSQQLIGHKAAWRVNHVDSRSVRVTPER